MLNDSVDKGSLDHHCIIGIILASSFSSACSPSFYFCRPQPRKDSSSSSSKSVAVSTTC
jgi:hypothetical protein